MIGNHLIDSEDDILTLTGNDIDEFREKSNYLPFFLICHAREMELKEALDKQGNVQGIITDYIHSSPCVS